MMTASETLSSKASLADVQAPVRAQLDRVPAERARIVSSDLPLVGQVSSHLLAMRGKLFRPTLLILSAAVGGEDDDEGVPLAACLELIHLATLVHDDAV